MHLPDTLLNELSVTDRLLLVDQLLEGVSLEMDSEPATPEVIALVHQRIEAIDSGSEVPQPWPQVYARLTNLLP